jgi:PKD repeat protein
MVVKRRAPKPMRSTIKGSFLLGSALMLILLLGGCFLFPNQSPVAQFAALPPGGDAPLTVQFDAQGSYDSDGYIISWQWDFGDGEIGVGIVVSHRYIAPGSYTVRLTVNDNRGSTVSSTLILVVSDSSTLILVVSDPGDFYRHYEWEYGEDRYYWNIAIPKWLYYEYRQRPRGPWYTREYDEYVLDPLDDMYMKSLGQTIESAMDGDYYKTVECAFNFVQAAVEYIHDPRGFEYPRYPIESLRGLSTPVIRSRAWWTRSEIAKTRPSYTPV